MREKKYVYEYSVDGRWYRGKDCKRQHGGWRWVKTSQCVECNKQQTKENAERRKNCEDPASASPESWNRLLRSRRMTA